MTKLAPDKNLGQNFLVNRSLCQKIVKTLVDVGPADAVLEIGPGQGALSEFLVESFQKIAFLELDPRMVESLSEKFSERIEKNELKIFHDSALSIPVADLHSYFQERKTSICGNLPYNVGQDIVFRFFEQAYWANNFCFMLQKEVVEKFKAKKNEKSYGPVSILWSLYCDIHDSFNVKPGSFFPPPKVTSAIFSFSREQERLEGLPCPSKESEAYQFLKKLLWKAFSQRRKKLHNKLEFLKGEELGQKRAEDLAPEEYLKLYLRAKESDNLIL